MSYLEDLSCSKLTITGSPLGTLETATGLTASHKDSGIIKKSVFTLAGLQQAVVNGTEYQGTKLFTFPLGKIVIVSAIANLAQTTTSTIASTLNSGVTGALSVGTVTASSTTLSSTMADIVPSTAFTTSTTINVAAAAVTGTLALPVLKDGSSTAKALFLNSAYATTTDVDADATQTFSGTITVLWMFQ